MQDNSLNKIQQYFHQSPILVGVFVFIQLLFIVIVIYLIQSTNTDTYKISNLPVFDLTKEIEGLPESSVDPIQTVLYDTVTMNGGAINSIKDSDIRIREETLKNIYFSEQNIHYVSFIIDIPSLEQSFQIFHEWTNDSTNQYYLVNRATMVMCPLESQIKYSNFQCRDNYDNNGQAFIVSQFLPYLSFDGFNALTRYDKAPYVIIIAPETFNVSEDTKSVFIEQTKEKITSLGFPSDLFSYYVSYGPEDPDLFLDYIISNH